MVFLNWGKKLFFVMVAGLGLVGGFFDLYYLLLISVILMFLSLSLPASIEHHQMSFLFPWFFFSSLSFNIRLAIAISSMNFYFSLFSFCLFLITIISLISIEELVLGVIGLLVWGEQKIIHYSHPFSMMHSDSRPLYYTRGYYPIKKAEDHSEHYLHRI